MDDRRHGIPVLETEDSLVLLEIAVDGVSVFFHCFPEPQFPQGDTKGAR